LGFLRFLVVGGLSLVADAGSLFVLHGVLKIWLPPATALAYGIAFVVNFGLNRAWVFQANGSAVRHLQRYIALVIVNLGITVVVVPALAAMGMQYLYAKLATAFVLACANYVVSRRWVFAEVRVRVTSIAPYGSQAGDGGR
jgi:putative flippase GtrA